MKAIYPVVLLLLLSFNSLAQKTKVGVINRDSLLNLIPGYATANEAYQLRRNEIADVKAQMVREIEHKKAENDSLKGQLSPLINQLRLMQLEQMKENLDAYTEYAVYDILYDSLRVAAFHFELDEAVQTVCRKKKCKLAVSPNRDSVKVIDLNADVAALLKEYGKFHADPKKIGCVNKDSLLRAFFPEYRYSKERTEREMSRYHYDSFVSPVVYYDSSGAEFDPQVIQDSLQRSDSLICAPYEKKFNEAWAAAMKERKVFYIYDTQVAYKAWPEKEVQFIDLNETMAKLLRP